MDAITLLKNEHRDVEKLFRRFENAGDRAYVEKREIVDRIVEALSKHAVIEEQIFYPVARATVPETDDVVLESLEEHHIVKWLLDELDGMDPAHERFDAKVTVLIENVRHHVEEEEQEFFPKVRAELGRNALNDIGDALEAARKVAPTHPHPTAPDTPPGNIVLGAAAAVTDRVSDTISGAAQGTVGALADLIARVLGRKRPARRTTGSSVARSTAKDVRSNIDGAAEAVIEKVRDAQEAADTAADGARTVARTARSGAKATATSAKRGAKAGAKRTTTTAKRAATTTQRTAKKAITATASAAKGA